MNIQDIRINESVNTVEVIAKCRDCGAVNRFTMTYDDSLRIDKFGVCVCIECGAEGKLRE